MPARKGTTMQRGLVGLGRMDAEIMLLPARGDAVVSRGEANFADRVLSAMRCGFRGHEEQKG